jgi:hypothetical protein
LKKKQTQNYPRYFIFTEIELLFLGVCILLDISEYIVAILLLPLFGDLLDLAGIVASFVMFRWIGLVSVIELIPGVDILPIFITTWIIWYITKKRVIPSKIGK